MSITAIESKWRETGIMCAVPGCGWMTFSDGKHRPCCGNEDCLTEVTDEQIYQYLITEKREDEALRQRNEAGKNELAYARHRAFMNAADIAFHFNDVGGFPIADEIGKAIMEKAENELAARD